MKTLFKLFVISVFTIISSHLYSQSTDILEHRGKIVQMTESEISILDYSSGEISTTTIWDRSGSLLQIKTGDEVTYIIVILRRDYPFNYIIKEIKTSR